MTEHYQTEADIARCRELLNQGYTKSKIMELMNIPDRRLREWTKIIHERDKIAWEDQANESLESRALIIKKKYQDLANECEKILHDEKKSPRDRIEAGKTGIACENNIYNMIKDGPLRLQAVTGKQLEDKSDNV